MYTLFVYGTLMPNCPNGHVLENIVGKFVPATVTGELIGAGWSAGMGYPGIKLDSDVDTVHGFLFYSHNLEDNWEYLDAFEGEEFIRLPVVVERYDELDVDTYIYALKENKESLEDQ
ncbi:MAG: gamma-glutamylcyclotransferase [Sulfurovum sp.]|nr:gamma-glutamylcyclotransferase [Sulfurovum sp.]